MAECSSDVSSDALEKVFGLIAKLICEIYEMKKCLDQNKGLITKIYEEIDRISFVGRNHCSS